MPEAARTRFRVPVELSVPRLLSAAGYAVQSSAASRRTTDFFDTADGRLAAADAELRFNRRAGWTWLRDPQGNPRLHAREWTAPASTDPEVPVSWSRAYHRGAEMAARAAVIVHRRSHRVSSEHGTEILTLLDERLDGPATRVRQLRIVSGEDAEAIEDIVELIIENEVTGQVPPALAGAAAVDPRSLFRRSTRLALMQWLYFDCELGGGHPDALRKLRVATRRLRSDLQTFRPLLDREWAAGIRERIGGLAHDLGVVRDAEVLAARLGELTSMAPRADGAAARALQDIAATQLEAARHGLLAALDHPGYLGLLDVVAEAVAEPRWSEGPPPSVTTMARRAWRRLRDVAERRPGEGGDDDEHLHRIRIVAKRARYAVEACVPAAGEPAAAGARAIAELQTILGHHHDAVVTRAWLRAQATASTGLAFTAGELAALELGRLDEAARAWPAAWAAASRKKEWRWLRS